MLEKIKQLSQKNTALLIAVGLGLVVSLVLLPLVLVSINLVVKNGEKKYTELEIIRVENVLQEEINRTSRTLRDWSSWNDTYQFAYDSNQDYVENNLFEDTYKNLDLNSILILNTSHQIVYSNFFDAASETFSKSPIDSSLFLQAYPELFDMNTSSGYKGLVSFQGYLMIVASNPILTSVNEGPPHGNIIFIKLLDEYRIKGLSRLTLRNLDIYSLNAPEKELQIIPGPSILQNDVFVYAKDANTISGYKYIEDIQGYPHLILKVDSPRELYLQGRTTKIIMSGILLVLIAFLSIVAYHFTNVILDGRERRKEEENASRLLEATRQNAIELEKKVVERTRELELKNKDLESFNYSVSHDLKSPLRGISGYSTLLLNEHADQLDSQGKVYLQNVVDAAQRMNLLIEDLLSYTKTERHEIIKTNVNLGKLFDTLLLEYNEALLKRSYSIVRNFECENILVDRDGIKLILRNLLDNALKFTQTTSNPKISLGCITTQTATIISVSDNGVGFEQKFHDKIFDIFERLHLSEEYPGTGIGLALVKKTADRLGGKVYAEGQIGVGSTFFLEIPLG